MSGEIEKRTLPTLLTPFLPKIVIQKCLQLSNERMVPHASQMYVALLHIKIEGLMTLFNTNKNIYENVLNDYYGTLVRLIDLNGGDIIQFLNGDQLVVMFQNNNKEQERETSKAAIILKAIHCAVTVKSQLKQYIVCLSRNQRLKVQLKMSISSGNIRNAYIGGQNKRWNYLIDGPPLRQLIPLRKIVKGGHILLTVSTWMCVKTKIEIIPIINHKFKKNFKLKRKNERESNINTTKMNNTMNRAIRAIHKMRGCWSASVVPTPTVQTIFTSLPPFTSCVQILRIKITNDSDNDNDEEEGKTASYKKLIKQPPQYDKPFQFCYNISRFIPTPVYHRLCVLSPVLHRGPLNDSHLYIQSNLLNKNRNVSFVSLSFNGILSSSSSSFIDLNTLQCVFSVVQKCVYKYSGCIHQIIANDDGGDSVGNSSNSSSSSSSSSLCCCLLFGGVNTLLDDASRSVLCCIDIYESLLRINIDIHIGIANGNVYSSLIGQLNNRCEYCLTGEIIHFSKHLMKLSIKQKNGNKILVCSNIYNKSKHLIEYALLRDGDDVENGRKKSITESEIFIPLLLVKEEEEEEEEEEKKMVVVKRKKITKNFQRKIK